MMDRGGALSRALSVRAEVSAGKGFADAVADAILQASRESVIAFYDDCNAWALSRAGENGDLYSAEFTIRAQELICVLMSALREAKGAARG